MAVIEKIIDEVEAVGHETGLEPQIAEQLKTLRQRLEHAKLQQDAQQLLTQQQTESAPPEEPSDVR